MMDVFPNDYCHYLFSNNPRTGWIQGFHKILVAKEIYLRKINLKKRMRSPCHPQLVPSPAGIEFVMHTKMAQ
jgi:hypothetical protein